MPTYEFMTDEGEIIEQMMPMSAAPPVGAVVTLDTPGGQVDATRILSASHVQGDNWKPYISSRLPRNLKGHPCTPSGKPIVTSKAQERNIMAKFGFERE